MQALHVEQVDGAHDAEAAGRQHDATQAVEANPESPRELVRHVRNCAQAAEIADDRGVDSQGHDYSEHDPPECKFDLHHSPPCFAFSSAASAAATSSRRCEIQ